MKSQTIAGVLIIESLSSTRPYEAFLSTNDLQGPQVFLLRNPFFRFDLILLCRDIEGINHRGLFNLEEQNSSILCLIVSAPTVLSSSLFSNGAFLTLIHHLSVEISMDLSRLGPLQFYHTNMSHKIAGFSATFTLNFLHNLFLVVYAQLEKIPRE